MQHTILIVDDCYSSREAVAAILGHTGHRVVCAAGVRQAARLMDDCSPDLLILDVALPDGSGIELLREIRETRPDIPALLLTGSGDARVLAPDLGVCDCLVKSIDGNARIRAAVDDALRRKLTTRCCTAS